MKKHIILFDDVPYEGDIIMENDDFRLVRMSDAPYDPELSETFIKSYFNDYKQDYTNVMDNVFIIDKEGGLILPLELD